MDEFFGWGPFRPDLEENYELLETLWTELRSVFKDDIMHLGGDEVPTGCWLNDENVKKWAEENSFENDSQIMRYHLDRLYEITKKVGFARTQVWNEAEGFESADTDEMDKRVRDPLEKPIIHSWMPWGSGYPTGFENILDRATAEGYRLLKKIDVCSCFFFKTAFMFILMFFSLFNNLLRKTWFSLAVGI